MKSKKKKIKTKWATNDPFGDMRLCNKNGNKFTKWWSQHYFSHPVQIFRLIEERKLNSVPGEKFIEQKKNTAQRITKNTNFREYQKLPHLFSVAFE